ncbi:MAG: alpha-L-rhamnosidase N-terminal domain-containing protein [Chloroflexi bacterium]|nr:alpha-L-rhamnosidase N-terminal domain-containing protein [Chloroflexota bacterium]
MIDHTRRCFRVLLIAAMAFCALASAGQSAEKPAQERKEAEAAAALQNSMIWLSSAPAGKQAYVVFRKQFDLETVPSSAALRLFADSRYILWINGRYVERGPCRFDPKAPEYDTLDITPHLRPGTNAIAVLVHHFHDGSDRTDWASLNGRIMRHAPGLCILVELTDAVAQTKIVRTDESWRGSTATRFLPSPLDRWENCWASLPDRIDARRDTGDWTLPGFDDAQWEQGARVDGGLWGSLRPRTIPRLRETEVGPLTVIEYSQDTNTLRRDRQPLGNLLPLQLNAGDRWVIDAGQFVQAYSDLDFEADAGSEFELEYAQRYFETGRKPSESYGRVNRYIARAGRQNYMSGDTFGFKYLALRLKSGQLKLHGVRLVNRLYPFDVAGSFRCDDELLTRLWSNCVQTIRVCSEDAYVDCSTRERTEWMADGYAVAYRTTRVALAGPGADGRPVYSDPRLLRNLLRHIAQSQQPDGRLKAHHPSDRWDIHGYIEDYACLWVQALREYCDHTDDLNLARAFWPALSAQGQWFLDRRTTNGLVKAREFVYFGNPLLYKVCEGATLNAFAYGALRDAAFLARSLGRDAQYEQFTTAAEQLARAVNLRLWDDSTGAYFGSIQDGKTTPPTAHATMSCLHFGLVPEPRREAARRWLLANYRKEGFYPYTHQFLLEEIYRADTDPADREVLDLVRERWGPMANGETGTVWEGFGPGESCHEAGAVPAYFLSAYVLGVRLDGPVTEKRLMIQPRLGNLQHAAGVVVTEHGPVPVSWTLNPAARGKRSPAQADAALDFVFEVPAGIQAKLSLPRLTEKAEMRLDGQEIDHTTFTFRGRWMELEIGTGKHVGRISTGPEGSQ